jgi:hypothetical protein
MRLREADQMPVETGDQERKVGIHNSMPTFTSICPNRFGGNAKNNVIAKVG